MQQQQQQAKQQQEQRMYSTPLPTTRRQQQQAMQPEHQEPESSESNVSCFRHRDSNRVLAIAATAVQEPALRMRCAMHVADSSTGRRQQQPATPLAMQKQLQALLSIFLSYQLGPTRPSHCRTMLL
jgi:hypothetical protein